MYKYPLDSVEAILKSIFPKNASSIILCKQCNEVCIFSDDFYDIIICLVLCYQFLMGGVDLIVIILVNFNEHFTFAYRSDGGRGGGQRGNLNQVTAQTHGGWRSNFYLCTQVVVLVTACP